MTETKTKTRYRAVVVSPDGEEWYVNSGDTKTKLDNLAVLFDTQDEAHTAAKYLMGHGRRQYWPSEHAAAKRAQEFYKDWTFKIEEVTNG